MQVQVLQSVVYRWHVVNLVRLKPDFPLLVFSNRNEQTRADVGVTLMYCILGCSLVRYRTNISEEYFSVALTGAIIVVLGLHGEENH